jgi:hypothetical protein
MRLLMIASTVACLAVLELGAVSGVSAKTTAGLPLGRYTCYQYSYSSGFLYFGFFKLLSSSTYKDGTAGSGRYAYAASTRKVRWLSGPYRRYGYKGEYQPKGTNGHKSNTIVLLGSGGVKIECSIGK